MASQPGYLFNDQVHSEAVITNKGCANQPGYLLNDQVHPRQSSPTWDAQVIPGTFSMTRCIPRQSSSTWDAFLVQVNRIQLTVLKSDTLKSDTSSKCGAIVAMNALSYTHFRCFIQANSFPDTEVVKAKGVCLDPGVVRFEDCQLYMVSVNGTYPFAF
jgi:hypothetical protein